ncbi:MAG: MFS transporter [Acidobacteriota bacterium]
MDNIKKSFFKKFPGQFWLVVIFEFFERGAYYGMMSFISVYFTDSLDIPKENVGLIKGVIQPLLYFLPIISGAVADRFGYRKILMIAFSLLGGGYFLTSQMTTYSSVFMALVVMGVGAGMFKPIISGTIARVTDESNSTQAFGIFYWSINLGAFLFPLFLVPFLKSMNPSYVIIASAICTGFLIIPTAFLYKDPVKKQKADTREQTSLVQTLANAFEIIYSPLVLLSNKIKSSFSFRSVTIIVLAVLLFFSVSGYLKPPVAEEKFSKIAVDNGNDTFILNVSRNMSVKDDFKLDINGKNNKEILLTIYKPDSFNSYADTITGKLLEADLSSIVGKEEISSLIRRSCNKISISMGRTDLAEQPFKVQKISEDNFNIQIDKNADTDKIKKELIDSLHTYSILKGINSKDMDTLMGAMNVRSFFPLFIVSMILISLVLIPLSSRRSLFLPVFAIVIIFFLPGLSLLGKIITSIIYLSLMSLVIIDKSDLNKFRDHSKFLLMILLYSGFWVLYFQMFDSVLWYVQAYVDASSLNNAINSFLSVFGININWFFDVEHVTVINAGVIILLQLIISNIVKNKKALPTMMTGISIATIGMGILAISANIWIFITGIILFSIGEMTAHPKFISYIGITAPPDKKAMYMGYLFLYGVFGSSVGGVVGAKLYVHFVDNLNQPRTLWLVFSGIGVVTIISLLLYNKYIAPKKGEAT